MSANVSLLIFYLVLAVGVSFLCSMCEAVLLTLTASDAEALSQRNAKAGRRLKGMKSSIDRPLAAILTLNTISHTVGAAGVGAQAAIVFGGYVGVTSAVLTLLILVLSEIIPKTIGAVYARRLAVPGTLVIEWMIWISYPVVRALEVIGRLFKGGGHGGAPTRQEIEILAELARSGGSIDQAESRIIRNLLNLRNVKARDVMTPRTVVFMLAADASVGETLEEHRKLAFSRIPIKGETVDEVQGMVLRTDLLEAAAAGRTAVLLSALKRDLAVVPESAGLLDVLRRFADTGEHIFLVVDEYGGTDGVLTLEDVLETILGAEIVDETDQAVDMRDLAMRESGDEPGADRTTGEGT
ncbi:MAG: hemolysin family protein [Planctomycetota bacterium]